ncbi:MAG: ATP-binding protein [Bacteroidota bacterium]
MMSENRIISTEFSKSLIEANLDPLVTIGIDGKILDMNKAFTQFSGIAHKELIGSNLFSYFTDSTIANEIFNQVFAQEKVIDFPLEFFRKSKKSTDVLFNGLTFKNQEGLVIGAVIVIRDMTQKKWAIELSIANKKLAFQNKEKEKRAAELGIANTELAYQNNEKEKRATELGIANKELAYQNDEKEKRATELGIANKELAYQNDEKEKRAAELGIANTELAYQNDEKEKRATELGIANKELAYQNDEKEKRATELGIANKELAYQNNEKEKRAAELGIANTELAYQNDEKEKRAAELIIANYARSLIEASRDPLFTINTNGKITDINQATVYVTGLTREELIGTDFFNYFTEPKKAKEVYKQVFKNGFVVDYPLTIVDGDHTPVLFNGSIYKDNKGNILGAVVIARDITEQNKNERELIEAKIFAEFATDIAEEAKQKAENATEIAENALKSKQQFLSNMSHEIRTPMNAIIGFTKVLLKTDLTDKQREYLNAIKLSGDALIVLINDILDLAKVNAGKMIFEKLPFNLDESITVMIQLFDTKIQEKNLTITKNIDAKIPKIVLGDSVRLHQIILNLLSNAIKFTSKGKIIISVNLVKEEEDKISIEFSVSDTGIGISPAKLETIFENFQQASSNTSRIFGGTGLGLAIVKQLVEKQGGTIKVESKENSGSTFSFILEFKKTNAKMEVEVDLEDLSPEKRNIKVLVVEDIALNQLLMKTILDDFGFERDIASNGKIAIEKMENNTYDIILMDLQMPEMNGFEATEYIRNELKSSIPIIALTADVTTVDLAKCNAVGMNDYLAKPVDDKLLYNKIVGLVKKSTLTSTVEKQNVKETNFSKIDLNYLTKRTKSNPVLITEMIYLYLKQTPILISEMKSSLLEKNWDLLQASAHKMIPSFSIMGISKEFEDLAKKIHEYASTQSQTDQIHEMVVVLENVCNQACDELNQELEKINKSN